MKPLVSVYCLAYNHENYIRDALESFVTQKTDFRYEVFVHDDASTDNTQEIIKEYAIKYPEIIRPILQKENQYSQGINIFAKFILPHIQGKYIAICEGDDYWCDDRKLQKQVDFLEAHTDYSFCTHNTKVINSLDGQEYFLNKSKEDRDIQTEEIIKWISGLFQTSCFMFKSEFAEVPSDFTIEGVGDYPKAVFLATCGKVRYLSEVMSVHRFLVPGSWSSNMYSEKENVEKKITHWRKRITMLNKVNQYTKGVYSECIEDTIRRNEYNIALANNEITTVRKKYPDYYSRLTLKEKIQIYIKKYCPCLLKMYRKVRSHF